MSLFLTPDELQELTGYKMPAHQIRWLRNRRWVFEVGGDGRPKVLRAHVERQLGGTVDGRKAEPQLRLP